MLCNLSPFTDVNMCGLSDLAQGLLLINPRNIISNIIMIFNINSTCGRTGSLLVVYYVSCSRCYVIFLTFHWRQYVQVPIGSCRAMRQYVQVIGSCRGVSISPYHCISGPILTDLPGYHILSVCVPQSLPLSSLPISGPFLTDLPGDHILSVCVPQSLPLSSLPISGPFLTDLPGYHILSVSVPQSLPLSSLPISGPFLKWKLV